MESLLSSNVAPKASALAHEASPPKHLANETTFTKSVLAY